MKNKTKKLVTSALMAAITCIATMIIKIPVPATGGYINPGDAAVILSGFILGPVYGGAAAGIGSALADIFSGYSIYAPATFIIKALMAITSGLILKNTSKTPMHRIIGTGVICEIIMTAGYLTYEALILGYGAGAAAAIIGNIIQGSCGIVISAAAIPAIRKIKRETAYTDK